MKNTNIYKRYRFPSEFTQRSGHMVKLISPQFVKPFVKTNKNDANDAEAIVEAAIRHFDALRPNPFTVNVYRIVIDAF